MLEKISMMRSFCAIRITAASLTSVVFASLMLVPVPLRAASYTWAVPSGDWSAAANWGGTLPTSNDNAYIANGGTANISLAGAACNYLYISSPTSANSSAIQMVGGGLSAAYESVGSDVTGTFNQSGGTNNIASLDVGYFLRCSGNYNLSGSAVVSAGYESVASSSGTGTFNQTGGLNSAGFLSIGSLGGYQFSGGTLQITGDGIANQGVFDATQSTGVLAGSGILDFSQGTLANTGSMSMSIGPNSLLLVPAGFNPATAFASYANLGLAHNVGTPLTVLPGQGFSGDGALSDFVNCQGTISAPSNDSINLNNGVIVSATGSVSLGGGSFTVNDLLSGISGGSISAWYEYVGYSGSGTFTQSGGTNSLGAGFANTGLYLGYNAGSSGTYNLTGSGVLTSYYEYLGSAAVGEFNQSGGTNYTSLLYLGQNLGSSGSYNLTGSGTLSALNDEWAGYSGTGAFTQSGGTNIIASGVLWLGQGKGAVGSYNLSGSGVLVVGGLEEVGYGGRGSFTQSGGTNSFNNTNGDICLGYNTDSSGSYNLTGSGVLSAQNECVGYSGTGTAIPGTGIAGDQGRCSLGKYRYAWPTEVPQNRE